MTAYNYKRGALDVQAELADDEVDDPTLHDDLSELEIAEYVVFLFALDTYLRYLFETTQNENAVDMVAKKGLMLVRFAETRHIAAIQAFFAEHLTNQTHRRMVERGFNFRPNGIGVARRALQLRTALSRGGSTTMRAVFKSQKALLAVRTAISAAMVDDADAALDKFAVITLRSARLRDWIDLAAKTAGSGAPPDVVSAATAGVGETSKQITEHGITETGRSVGSAAAVDATTARDMLLQKVQVEAQEAAKRSLAQAQKPDDVPTRSEVVAIATAAAVAATSDPDNNRNIPPSLARLSDENRAVALMGGRVRVAAGAGAGKSTTLCARVDYLIHEQGVAPERILVTSFNTKAASELKGKITANSGPENANAMTIKTMHGVFLSFIMKYGTQAEKAMFMGRSQDRRTGKETTGVRVLKDAQIMKLVLKAWDKCFPQPTGEHGKIPDFPSAQLWKYTPKPKRMRAYLNKFQGSGWSLPQVQAWARASLEPEHIQAAVFFEFYEGFKGAFGRDWAPKACPNVTRSKEYQDVETRVRGGAARAGDFQDMLTVFRNMMRDNPQVAKTLQGQFDHIFIDECQDLNPVQTEAFLALAKGIETDDPKKGIWMVGDDKQSIYMFRGAAPELFRNLDQEGFKTGYMRTNRRSLPEIVEVANKLVAHNEDQIQMDAVPLPDKPRGKASIEVVIPPDNAAGAIVFADKAKTAQTEGDPLTDFAVLARTNAELHNFETACIVRGVPYVRKGTSSFLGAPEAKTFTAFIDLATSNEPDRLQAALAEALVSTSRLPLGGKKPEQVADAIASAVDRHCSRNGVDPKTFNPIVAMMTETRFRDALSEALAGKKLEDWKLGKDGNILADFANEVVTLRTKAADQRSEGGDLYTTTDLFNDILAIPTTERVLDETGKWTVNEVTLKNKLVKQLKLSDLDKEEADEDEEVEDEALGAISFFMEMLKPDPTEPDIDPANPIDFRRRLDRYKQRAKDLRYDPDKWEKEHGPGSKPPGVYLGTVHSVKGAEWKDVTVLMPVGVFPHGGGRRRPDDHECPQVALFNPEIEMQSERRLGYVAMTRAIESMTILCPFENAMRGLPPNSPRPPREAAISKFVTEAGLHEGQNVEPAAKPVPDDVLTPVTPAEIDGLADIVAPSPPELVDVPDEAVKVAYNYGRFVACGCGDDPLGAAPEGEADAWRD